LINMHLVLGHVVADHSFTNNYKIRSYRGTKLFGHMVWSIFALLAFTFDTLLKSRTGVFVLVAFSAFHIWGDYERAQLYSKGKKRMIDLLELLLLVAAIIANSVVHDKLSGSYLTAEFVYYLMGMSVVSTGVTYFFRNFYPGVENMSDIEGISERLAFFVFLLAGKPGFAYLSLGLGFLYRLLRIKRYDPTWWMSPILGIILTYIWKFTLYR
jgi:hypothetical protein